MTNIKPGYILKLTTWENDADNYMTKEFTGLEVDHVKFYVDVALMFRSTYDGGKYGNVDRHSDYEGRENDSELVPDLKKIVDSYNQNNVSVPKEFDYHILSEEDSKYVEDILRDAVTELVGSWADGEYWRVVEDFEVFYLPTELVNVTSEFKE
jgi:hypothetical protein